ncbi:hypothetical protein B5S28_g1987 [[Candida] boidinii]|nr:hypothetical protein B5S28_g1987 [[Candida] boidinii]OWB78474.1 hypothetical protein B5S32_g2668 [[Candida] boidinii]
MSLVLGYNSDSDSNSDSAGDTKDFKATASHSISTVSAKPDVKTNSRELILVGDSHISSKKTFSGIVEKTIFDDLTFKNKKRLHDISNGDGLNDLEYYKSQKSTKLESKRIKKQRKTKGDASDIDNYKGPWASYSESSDEDDSDKEEEDDEDEDEDGGETVLKNNNSHSEEVTKFYKSKSYPDEEGELCYMEPSKDITIDFTKPIGSQECFVPKTQVHVYDGHYKGTQQIQFLPQTGHLLLSCGNDSMIKLWDVYHSRQLLRSFEGHERSVKFVHFNNSGSEFISCSYDKYVKLWDTETGKCKTKIRLNAIPNVCKFNPNEDKQNEFLVGLTNKKIEHFDSRTNESIQTYDHHMGAINSITFVDDNKKFMTSSDDKSLRVWNWQINMPIKQISDPSQHSMPCLSLHPNGKYVVAQSMDNSIVTFLAHDKFKKNKKKYFDGHNSSGYSINLDFSPDGKNLMSGDNNGFAFFWDWKTCKLIKKLKVDNKVISTIASHPRETSTVCMSGQSGKIYLYN